MHSLKPDPIAALMEEHRVIERGISVLQVVASKLDAGEKIDPSILLSLVEFVRNFADRCHHSKEEKVLFRVFSEHGIPVEGGPIGVMLSEHEQGRKAAAAMAEAAAKMESGDLAQARVFSSKAKEYAELLTQHIYKEDNILYPMGSRLLSEDEKRSLIDKFEGVEREEVGEGVHKRYVDLICELEEEIR